MFFSAARLFTALTALTYSTTVLSSPLNCTLVPQVAATNDSPVFLAYWDQWISGEKGPPAPSTIKGFNVLALSFLLTWGAADQASEWAQIDSAIRSSIKAQYNKAGIKLIVSAFGSTDAPTTAGQDPSQLAYTMAEWVKTHDLDGIDVDYEDFNAVAAGTAADWLVTFTTVLRQNLPQGQFIITHAPIAPWFSSTTGAPYLSVDNRVGHLIDWYNVQFYSQESSYTTCTGLLFNSGTPWTKSSIFEIHAAGVSLHKILMGKPATAAEASGYISPSLLATCVQQAKNAGWKGGIMVWQYPDADLSWIKTVRSLSWPI